VSEFKFIKLNFLILFFFINHWINAAQLGPYFPTHRFPTDKSFHLGYNLGYFKSQNNFSTGGTAQPLLLSSSISRFQHQFIPEYQPTRFLAIGAYFNFDSLQIRDSSSNSEGKNAFSDQVFFVEYRMFDVPGSSIGIAILGKFPLYENITSGKLNSTGKRSTVLLGDAQSDYSLMATSEVWPQKHFRVRGDFGYTYRSDDYSAEIPYQLGLAYVNMKLDLELRLKGNLSLDNDKLNPNDPSSKATVQVQNAFGGSQYALSGNPILHIFEVAGEYWFNPLWNLMASYSMPYKGNDAPKYWQCRFGLTYRWVERDQYIRRTIKDVDISTDQEKGKFEDDSNDEFVQ
jgi:hypothetical protein